MLLCSLPTICAYWANSSSGSTWRRIHMCIHISLICCFDPFFKLLSLWLERHLRFLCFSLPLSPLLHLCLRLLLCLRHLLRFCLECRRHLEPFPACCVSRVAIRQSPLDSSSASPDSISPSFFYLPLFFFCPPSLSSCFPLLAATQHKFSAARFSGLPTQQQRSFPPPPPLRLPWRWFNKDFRFNSCAAPLLP